MALPAVLGAVAAVVGAAKGTIETAEMISDWAERSAIIEIANLSADTLRFAHFEMHSGDLQRPLPDKIRPFDHVLITAVSDTFLTGAVGDLHFQGRDMTLFLDYSNPVAGGNDLDADIRGPRAGEFRWATAAGPGNKSAKFHCAVWQEWQDEWRFCPKCRGVFSPGIGSRCPAGGPHDPLGWNYILLHDVPEGPNLQASWRFCPKCRGLFAEGDGNGVCPGGGPHDPVGWRYCVPHDLAPGSHLQSGWRFCGKCRALFGEADGNGVCPAGETHAPIGWPYLMVFATPD
jgi:hypothetical protein